jgi:hypothetical protein
LLKVIHILVKDLDGAERRSVLEFTSTGRYDTSMLAHLILGLEDVQRIRLGEDKSGNT